MQQNKISIDPLFVWRIKTTEREIGIGEADTSIMPLLDKEIQLIAQNSKLGTTACKYCSNLMLDCADRRLFQNYCTFCGYGYGRGYSIPFDDIALSIISETTLRVFELNSPELAINESGNYIRSNYSLIYHLDPRKFELLIGDIFKNLGYEVIMTKCTRDGGYDLILLTEGQKQIIVEAKRYAGKVGVEIIRQLRGVQLINDFHHAILVTSGTFTRDALRELNIDTPLKYGFSIELMDAEDLLRALDIYKDNKTLANNINEKFKTGV